MSKPRFGKGQKKVQQQKHIFTSTSPPRMTVFHVCIAKPKPGLGLLSLILGAHMLQDVRGEVVRQEVGLVHTPPLQYPAHGIWVQRTQDVGDQNMDQ
eukprot:7158039-Lingulodinium_polyedra.AAC.1